MYEIHKNLSVDHKYTIFILFFYQLNWNNLHASIILYDAFYLTHILFKNVFVYLLIYFNYLFAHFEDYLFIIGWCICKFNMDLLEAMYWICWKQKPIYILTLFLCLINLVMTIKLKINNY